MSKDQVIQNKFAEKGEVLPSDSEFKRKIDELCKGIHPYEHIESMDYPRMVGTEGAQRGAEYIENKFREYGYEPKIEEFYFPQSSATSRSILPIGITLICVFSLINISFIKGILGTIFALLILSIPIIVLLLILKLEVVFKKILAWNWKKIQKSFQQMEIGISNKSVKKGKNIYVEYTPPEFDEHLYLTAHYDSTTLRINLFTIKICLFFGIIAAILYFSGYFLHYFYQITRGLDFFGANSPIFVIIFFIFIVPLDIILFGRAFRTNTSHGANDDLTGVALILDLAKITKLVKPKIKITFIAFSAEEAGLFGSAYHYHKNKEYFQSANVHVVSIDLVGEIPPLSLVERIKPVFGIPLSKEFNNEMVKLAHKLGIEVKLRKILYPGSDFAHWFLDGYQTNWIMTPSNYIHSSKDVAQNVNQSLLNSCLKLFVAYLIQKDK